VVILIYSALVTPRENANENMKLDLFNHHNTLNEIAKKQPADKRSTVEVPGIE
jgi:hypothetical protein